ncbi:MAG: hypothetical protein CK430_12780 [Legionella sp.]|nr:MAG: hypothetical protein CK430_12780 [Legionella sp.]
MGTFLKSIDEIQVELKIILDKLTLNNMSDFISTYEINEDSSEKKEDVFYYHFVDNKIVVQFYYLDGSVENFDVELNADDDLTTIKQKIILKAMRLGYIGILKEFKNILKILGDIDRMVIGNETSVLLQEKIQIYNDNLRDLEQYFSRTEDLNLLEDLKLNNRLSPLPGPINTKSVQIASSAPARERFYRRSQDGHLCYKTHADGKKIIGCKLSEVNKKKYDKTEILIAIDENQQLLVNIEGKLVIIDPSIEDKKKIAFKIIEGKKFNNQELRAILEAIAVKTGTKYNLKYELNRFGENVSDVLAEDGDPYSVGANTSRVDRVISYIPKKSSSRTSYIPTKRNNKNLNELRDRILVHKNKVVEILVNQLALEKFDWLNVNREQLRANYPCLIITFPAINLEGLGRVDFNRDGKEIPKGYPEFITHLMIAQINLKLKAKNLYPLIERRQSFGFLTPTLSEVETGVRLSLGLTPNKEWIDCVIEGIKETNTALNELEFKKAQDPLLVRNFLGGELCGEAHKYLFNLYNRKETSQIITRKEVSSVLEVAAKKPKVFLSKTDIDRQNLIKIEKGALKKYYYFNEIENIIIIYDKSGNKSIPVDKNKINYFLKNNFDEEKIYSLNDEQEIWLIDAINHAIPSFDEKHKSDNEFNVIYSEIMLVYLKIINSNSELPDISDSNDLEYLTRSLCETQDLAVKYLLKKNPLITEDTSDEDSDNEFTQKNYYSPAGMSALFAPLYAARKVFNSKTNMATPYGCDLWNYFEVALTWNKALDINQFIRCDWTEEMYKRNSFKIVHQKLAEDASLPPLNYLAGQICFKHIIPIIYAHKIKGKKLDIQEIIVQCFDEISQELKINSKHIDHYPSLQENLNDILEKGIRIINEFSLTYINEKTIDKLQKPVVYYADNNPCINKENIEVNTAVQVLANLLKESVHPQVFVLDTTSSTTDQIQTFITEFNKQDKIPILVTATSMAKHHELGLDLWQGGINKAYLSARCTQDKEKVEDFSRFTRELKSVTRSTESGLSRFARRFIREKLHTTFMSTELQRERAFFPSIKKEKLKNKERNNNSSLSPRNFNRVD